jgi:NAD(P)-dependent dehydrogenase (short-subunit alcohol dehydrogenase family)
VRFTDRVVIITGGGAGIGRVMATRFAAEGARVAIGDLDEANAGDAAAAIETAGGRALGLRADVTVAADVDRLVTAAEQELGPVDVLVNNAYSCAGDYLACMEDEVWDQDLRGTVTSAFLCTKRVLTPMIERRSGVIVNITSVNGLSYVGNEAYSAGKAAMINLTQSVAARYGRHGIRCNAIAPGSIATAAWRERVEKEPDILERLVKWYPLGRVGTPDDVASAALFLASDEAAWITGTVLRVDGGLLAGNDVMATELLVESRGRD